MTKINCWESKGCGREPGGTKVAELGICPAAAEAKVNGVHGGINGGRVCWAVAGTFCGGQAQGSFALKASTCLRCDFYHRVSEEEGAELISVKKILETLK